MISRRKLIACAVALVTLGGAAACERSSDKYTFEVESVGGVDKTALVTANNDPDGKGKPANISPATLPWQATLYLDKGQRDWWALSLLATGNMGAVTCRISKNGEVVRTETGYTAHCVLELF